MTRLQRETEPWPANSWMLAGANFLAPRPYLAAQPVYKITDADGNVTFSKAPPLSGDSTIEEHSLPAPNSNKPCQTTLTPAAPAEAEEPASEDTRIGTPADNATMPMVSGNFAVWAARNPRLASSETLHLVPDGEPVDVPRQTARWQLSNVYRGEHRLQAVRLDENGEQLDASAASTVYLPRPSLSR